MRTRNCFHSFVLLALVALVCGACNATPKQQPTFTTGNMVITVTPKNLATPELLVTYWTDRDSGFSAVLATQGEGFRIKTPGGWHDLEDVSKIAVETSGGVTRVVLTDTQVVALELEAKQIGLKSLSEKSVATADYAGFNELTSEHDFAVYVVFEKTIYILEVHAKS